MNRRSKMNGRSKKGSYIMEAAIVLPMIIFVTITIVLIIMFFYRQATEQSRLHVTLRSEAGKLTQKTSCLSIGSRSSDSDAEVYRDEKAIGGQVYGKKYLIMPHRGVLNEKGTFTTEGSFYATDGSEYVRYCELVKSAGGSDDAEQ